jgi:hypothetical protein
MNKWPTKVIFVVVAIVVGLPFLLTVTVILFLWTAPGKKVSQRMDERAREGIEFGKTAEQRDCINEGFTRGKKTALYDVTGQVENHSFVRGCLQTSRPTAGFCDGVPSRSKNIFVAWDEKQCEQSEVPGCEGILREQVHACDR